jgi:hypothetical protein
MKPIVLTSIAAAVLAARAPLAAQQATPEPLPQLAQELFLAETVYSQERGDIQLTVFGRSEPEANARFLGEYGITDRLQVSLVTPAAGGEADDEDKAWEPGVLYAIFPADAPLAVSVELEASFAKGEATQWEPALIAARHFGPVQLHGSVRTELSNPGDAVSGALAALVDAGRLTPTLEAVWAGSDDDYVVPGLFVHLTEKMEVAVGVPVCINCGSTGTNHEVRAMFTLDF